MVLVDTSVWIRFFANRAPYAAGLDALLGRGDVGGHDFVLGELRMGDPGGRPHLLGTYSLLPRAAMVPHDEVMEFVRHRRLCGRGIGWIDVHLLASALVSRMQVWTADARLAAVAAELGVSYD